MSIKHLGRATNIEVINRFVSLQGKFVADVGCGQMDFSRELAWQGARVLAIDPDPIQAQSNRTAEPTIGLEFVAAGAEHLPVADRTLDGIFFVYSLHHIPATNHQQVFDEVLRALKVNGRYSRSKRQGSL